MRSVVAVLVPIISRRKGEISELPQSKTSPLRIHRPFHWVSGIHDDLRYAPNEWCGFGSAMRCDYLAFQPTLLTYTYSVHKLRYPLPAHSPPWSVHLVLILHHDWVSRFASVQIPYKGKKRVAYQGRSCILPHCHCQRKGFFGSISFAVAFVYSDWLKL